MGLTHCLFGRQSSVLTKDPSTSAVHALTLFHCRLRDSVSWPRQRWKPWSPWRLPPSNRGRWPPGRASGKPHWPSLLHAELLLHLLTLINSHPPPPLPPLTSEMQLMESVHQHACGTTLHETAYTQTSPYHRQKSSQVNHTNNTTLQQISIMFPSSFLDKNHMLEIQTL